MVVVVVPGYSTLNRLTNYKQLYFAKKSQDPQSFSCFPLLHLRFLGAITTGCMRPFVPRTN